MGPTPTIVTSPAGSPWVVARSASFGAHGARHPLGGRWLWWSAIGFVALYLGAVRTAGGQRLDQAAMLLISAASGSDTWAEVTVPAVAGLAVALMIALPKALRWPMAVLVAGPAVGFTGLATVVLLWHRPSDVVGSVLPRRHGLCTRNRAA